MLDACSVFYLIVRKSLCLKINNHKIKNVVTSNNPDEFTNITDPIEKGNNDCKTDFPENISEPNPAKKTIKMDRTPSQIEIPPNQLNLLLNTNLLKALNSCLKSL